MVGLHLRLRHPKLAADLVELGLEREDFLAEGGEFRLSAFAGQSDGVSRIADLDPTPKTDVPTIPDLESGAVATRTDETRCTVLLIQSRGGKTIRVRSSDRRPMTPDAG